MKTPVVDALITDIEGTTTSIAFVHETLFPYARKNLPKFMHDHGDRDDVRAAIDELKAFAEVVTDQQAIDIAIQYIDEDRKARALKTLQGLLWEEGYRSGAYVAHIFPDVPNQLRAFRQAGIRLYVYSSGSVHAQKLLFQHSTAGDLTSLFDGYFDTRTGPKKVSESYRIIARTVACEPARAVFLSDVNDELDAATAAGLRTLGLRRPGNAEVGPTSHQFVSSFDEIDLDTSTLRARKA